MTKNLENSKNLEINLIEEARKLMSKYSKNSKISENESKTGYSYFAGKTRLLKILKTKRNIKIEINIKLSKNLENLENLEKISAAQAHKKHLGTMKYIYSCQNIKNIQIILKDITENFKKLENSENSQTIENSK